MSYNLTLHKKDYFPHQWSFLTSKKPVTGLISGFGSGKTFVFIRRIFISHIVKKNNKGVSNGWIIYPTYDLAEELFVQPFKELLEDKGIYYEYNIAKHKFVTAYGTIKIYQLQKPQRIIGAELTYIGFDEFDVESYKNCDIAFKKAIGRMRGSNDCQMYIVSTPEGYHYCHKIFVEDNNEDRLLIHGKTKDNTYLPENYIKLLESNYDDRMLQAYMDGKFVNLQKGSTYAFNRDVNVRECKYDRTKPIYVGMDFNNDPMACCIIQEQPNKPQIKVIDEILLTHQGSGDLLTDRMCQTIRQRYPNNKYHIFPDATGASKHSSSRYSDIELIRRQPDFQVHVRHINPLVINRVNSVNNNLNKGNVIIDPKCKSLIKDFEQVVNKKGTREIDKAGMSSDLSHSSDAFGYYCDFRKPTIKPSIGTQDR